MTHRGTDIGRERGPLRKVLWELAALVVIAAVFSVLFIIGDLLRYGTVRW